MLLMLLAELINRRLNNPGFVRDDELHAPRTPDIYAKPAPDLVLGRS